MVRMSLRIGDSVKQSTGIELVYYTTDRLTLLLAEPIHFLQTLDSASTS